MDAHILEQWFRLADEDKDGLIGGAEAVRFFMKSGLAPECLSQVRALGPRQADTCCHTCCIVRTT